MTTGLFKIDRAARTARGVLLPWGVRSKGISASKTAPITFPRGSVKIPRDPVVVGRNDEHNRFPTIGRAVSLVDEPDGIVATFAFADTDEADAWLAGHDGELAWFSAEIDELVRHPGDDGSGVLAGAAVTKTPAFDGTGVALFSLLGEERLELELEPEPDAVEPDEAPDETTVSPDQTPETPAETEGDAMADAVVPQSMLASRRRGGDAELTKAGFFAALNAAKSTGDRTALMPYAAAAAEIGLFALSNVKYDGTGGLVSDALMPGTWLGELWQGRRFARRIIPLLTSGTLTSLNATGWVWSVRPAMAAWAGNKTAVPTNEPTVAPKSFPGQRFAGGHDLAIEYYHFGQTDVIDSYADAMIDSYAELSDAYALTKVVAGGTLYTPDPANTVNTGLLDVVDGALAVVAGGGSPSWAIVAPDVYKGILATPHEDALDYLGAAIGLEGGSVSGAASFAIVPDARLGAGGIVVGDRAGATSWELPGVPIRVEAPDLVLGGVDNAFFGYIAVGVTNPNVIVKNAEAIVNPAVEDALVVAAEKSRK